MALTKRHAIARVGEVDQSRSRTPCVKLKTCGCFFPAPDAAAYQTHGAKSIASRHAVVMERVRETIRSFRPAVGTLVRVVSITGVGLRENTDAAVVLNDKNGSPTIHGSVLRGVADDLVLAAPSGRSLVRVPVSDGDAAAAGLVCGGRATLLVSPIQDLPPEAIQWLADSEPVVIVAAADGSGSDLAVSTKGQAGSLGSPELDAAAVSAARQTIRRGSSVAEVHEINDSSLLLSAAIPTTRHRCAVPLVCFRFPLSFLRRSALQVRRDGSPCSRCCRLKQSC